jgi:DNA-directed RNA polymerase sigma subunit (sigma70/sigma32)
MDLAEKIAGNFARRTIHPKEDLLQLAMIGLIKAARRNDPSRGPFRPYGRTYANGEITHFLRDNGFLLKVPPTWRELHARGQRLLTSGIGVAEMLERLGVCLTFPQAQPPRPRSPLGVPIAALSLGPERP